MKATLTDPRTGETHVLTDPVYSPNGAFLFGLSDEEFDGSNHVGYRVADWDVTFYSSSIRPTTNRPTRTLADRTDEIVREIDAVLVSAS